MLKRFNLGAETLMIIGILIFINVLASYFHTYIDLSADKRFTLTSSTKKIIKDIPDVMFVRVLLDGNFPAGFKRLQQSTKEILDQFASENGYIEYQFEDPNSGSTEDINARRQEFTKDGLVPTNLMVRSGAENKEQLIFPYAILNYGEKKIAINLLESSAELGQDENLSNSISLLEYKFANGIQKILKKDKKNVLITDGHGELSQDQSQALFALLSPFYNVGRINLDSAVVLKKEIDLLIIARPRIPYSEKNKFSLDQYVMNGGKIIFYLDKLAMSLDSMQTRKEYIPEPLDLNLDDLLFRYGFRIENGFVLDLECSNIPQVIGSQGGKSQVELFPWYYHPLLASNSNHPIVSNIDRVSSEFPSFIDTVKTKNPLNRTVLLQSSQYSRYQLSPMKIDFEILHYKPDPSKFNKPNLPIAILAEGNFNSLYENRIDEGMQEKLKEAHAEFKTSSSPTSIMVVADGDIPKNLFDKASGKYAPIGFNKWEKRVFNGNKDFIINSVEYMTTPDNVLSARSKEIKLRMLDKVKAEQEKAFWQFLNIGAPLLLLVLFGFVNQYIRKKKYIRNPAI